MLGTISERYLGTHFRSQLPRRITGAVGVGFDEFTTALEITIQVKVLAKRGGIAGIYATHNWAAVVQIANRALLSKIQLSGKVSKIQLQTASKVAGSRRDALLDVRNLVIG